MAVCGTCGVDNPVAARFCASCGSRLPQPGADAFARKPVTIVFADVSGFTSLAGRVDPELMSGLMSVYFAAMRAVVDRHGGTVEKFIGDAVMAVFGVPTLHEDDAIRAVRTAAEMQEALAELNVDLEARWGERLKLHVGINTGVVATGTGTLVVGDAVNVAARLQQRAAPQEIVLGEETYRLVRGVVEVEPLEPLDFKGKAAPVAAYRLLRVARDAFQRRSRFQVPLVGRGQELAELTAHFEDVAGAQACRLVAVVAPAGVGKSRLIEDFAASVRPRADVFRGYCDPYGEGTTFLPLADVLRQAAGIDDDDPPEVALAKLAGTVNSDESPQRVVDNLAQLLGLATATLSSDDLFWAVRKIFESLARRRPLVLVFEDVHWAQPTFLDLLEHVRVWARDAPILVLCSSRPEILERYPAWAVPAPNLFRLTLSPLSEEESHHLVDTILGAPAAGRDLPPRVVATAEGNPLYLVEIVGMLLDKGHLVEEEGTWILLGGDEELEIPTSIQAIVGSRLERLGNDARHVIEAASVMGTSFRRPPLAHLLVAARGEQLERAIREVVEEQLFVAAPPGTDDDLRFYHVVARDVAYAGASKETRWTLHERFAAWLESSLGDRLAEQEDVIGYHLEQAGTYLRELRPGDGRVAELGLRAGRRLAAAGRSALGRGDLAAGVNLLSRARALLPYGDELRTSLVLPLSDALFFTGQPQRALEVLQEGFALADESDDPVLRAHLSLLNAQAQMYAAPEGGAQAALRDSEAVMPVFEAAGDELGLSRTWRLRSAVYIVLARIEMAEQAMARAFEHARRAGAQRDAAEALAWWPLLVWIGPTPPAEGLPRCRHIVELAGGDERVRASSLLATSAFEAMQGSIDVARRGAVRARALFEDLGLAVWIFGPQAQFHGWIEMLAGDPVAAEVALREGYDGFRRMNQFAWLSRLAGMLGLALSEQGRHDEAEELGRICEDMASSDDGYAQALALMVRARYQAAQANPDEAVRLARAAVGLCEPTDLLQLHGDALMVLADVLVADGQAGEADVALSRASELFAAKGSTVRDREAKQKRSRLHQGAPAAPRPAAGAGPAGGAAPS
ncbi:MAG: hypothetical protein QOI99_379 [Actinomycetota bacterium]|nr:hypothetical protein [Actinomycetota bacterium]